MENRLITEQLAEQIAKYPLYSQDGLGKAAICIGILELANIKWYVLEGQQEGNDYTLFTIVAGLAETEYGYTSANELASIQVNVLAPHATFEIRVAYLIVPQCVLECYPKVWLLIEVVPYFLAVCFTYTDVYTTTSQIRKQSGVTQILD